MNDLPSSNPILLHSPREQHFPCHFFPPSSSSLSSIWGPRSIAVPTITIDMIGDTSELGGLYTKDLDMPYVCIQHCLVIIPPYPLLSQVDMPEVKISTPLPSSLRFSYTRHTYMHACMQERRDPMLIKNPSSSSF